jgi:dUTP pyrophosphatase
MELKIERIDKDLDLPKFAHETDAAMDLYSSCNYEIKPMQKVIVKTGIKMAIPKGYVGLIWDRSGMAAKYSMHTMAGVIDSGYRGEIGVVLINLGSDVFNINKGMRIAQILIQPCLNVSVLEVESIENNTDRGEGGFGSTGV